MFKINQFNKLDRIFIFLAIIFGSLVLFFPVQYLLIAFFCLILVIYFLANPVHCYYGIIFALPLNNYYINYIALHDVLSVICLLSVSFKLLSDTEKPDLSTKFDKWIILLVILFFFEGFRSPDLARGVLYSFRFFEAVLFFYLTLYFVRSKQTKASSVIKVIVFTAIIQSILAVFQSFTGMGAQAWAENRSYLSYLGLNSVFCYGGRGTFSIFSQFAYYIGTVLLFFMPINRFILRKKLFGNIIIAVLFAGLFFSYSRGALSGFILVFVYYLYHLDKNKIKFLKNLFLISLILIPSLVFLIADTNFVSTLNPRDYIWYLHFIYLQDNLQNLWFGTGLQSQWLNLIPYLPGNVTLDYISSFNTHNLYLYYVEEIGIIGAVIYLSFLGKQFFYSLINIDNKKNYIKTLNLSFNLCLVYVFYSGLNDHVYRHPHMIMFLMLLLGIIFAKTENVSLIKYFDAEHTRYLNKLSC